MYPSRNRPLAISHRGLRSAAPENSIPAFLAAIEAGADGIELDVHASTDGVVFVHHDPAPHATGAGGEPVREGFASLSSDVIATLELAPGVPIPTLDDVLDSVEDRVDVFIEIKATRIEHLVAACLRRRQSLLPRYAVHAFDHRAVRRMLELMPALRTGILQVAYPIDSVSAMRAAGASDLWQHADFIDALLVADVRARRGRLIAWTSNAPEQWDALMALGVDGICTDRVDEYVSHRERGA